MSMNKRTMDYGRGFGKFTAMLRFMIRYGGGWIALKNGTLFMVRTKGFVPSKPISAEMGG